MPNSKAADSFTTRHLKRLGGLVFGRHMHQVRTVIEREIVGQCESVLDLGCGSDSVIGSIKDRLSRSVGTDLFDPSLELSRQKRLHHEYFNIDVLEAADQFGPDSFDCVVAIDLIEHLERDDGLRLIEQMEMMARIKVIIFTPNGFVPQEPFDGNQWQRHISGWGVDEMRDRGYKVIGINGWKPLRGEFARVRWWPKSLWNVISIISQLFTTRNPAHAFQLLCVKQMRGASTP
ncbi:MAG: class I SAM-dependent methyltransferase [Candidatus Marinimicrobia bacterium]|nr:class I SAM-dependent methyltransferase [Candidatus Neomarinimicrobiota bacterium]